MLIRFSVENYGSIRDEQTLDLTLRNDAELPFQESPLGERISCVAMIYGPNASGKTTLLDALIALREAVRLSHRAWDPGGGVESARPFRLRPRPQDFPTVWTAEFAPRDLDEPGHYTYRVQATSERVIEESLTFRSARTRSTRRIFVREGREVRASRKGLESLSNRLRENALFLSLAAQENQEVVMPAFRWLSGQISRVEDLRTNAGPGLMNVKSEDLTELAEWAQAADLGILDVRYAETLSDVLAKKHEVLDAVRRALKETVPNAVLEDDHESGRELEFLHRGESGQTYALRSSEESDGTLAFLTALLSVQRAIASGGVTLFDELDASLHPVLVESLVSLFRSPETNRTGAQLLATTHDTHLFGRNALMPLAKHEVWFTEKGWDGATHVLGLKTRPDVRPTVDQEARYLAGAFGAIPQPSPIRLVHG